MQREWGDNLSEISDRLLSCVLSSNLSYAELAQRTGIPKSALQRYCTGVTEKIPLDRLKKIADALETSVTFLLGWGENKENEVCGKNLIRIAGRDGSYQERKLSDEQLAALKAILDQMPDVTDDL